MNDEKEKCMVISFILRSDENRFKKLKHYLKSFANRVRDEHSITLTEAFNFLVRESGENGTVRNFNPRFRGTRGSRGGRGKQNFLFAQSLRCVSGRGNDFTYSLMNNCNATEVVTGASGKKFPLLGANSWVTIVTNARISPELLFPP